MTAQVFATIGVGCGRCGARWPGKAGWSACPVSVVSTLHTSPPPHNGSSVVCWRRTASLQYCGLPLFYWFDVLPTVHCGLIAAAICSLATRINSSSQAEQHKDSSQSSSAHRAGLVFNIGLNPRGGAQSSSYSAISVGSQNIF